MTTRKLQPENYNRSLVFFFFVRARGTMFRKTLEDALLKQNNAFDVGTHALDGG